MSIKSTLTAIALAMTSTIATANGIYLVSGADFRPFQIKYTVRTTEPNETVEIVPGVVKLLSQYQSSFRKSNYGWSVKTMGQEFHYGYLDNIRNDTTPGQYMTNATPMTFTYPEPGLHTVKLIDPNWNMYIWTFTNMQKVVKFHLDLSEPPNPNWWKNFSSALRISMNANSLPDLREIYLNIPPMYNSEQTFSLNMCGATNISRFVCIHPEAFTQITQHQLVHANITNDLVFPRVIFIDSDFLCCTPGVNYLSLPAVETIGRYVCNIYNAPNKSEMQRLGLGLRKLRIGDGITQIGVNSFWGQELLEEIEFVCDEDNWVDVWNAKTFLTQFFGVATATEDPNVATMARLPNDQIPSDVYSPTGRLPAPTTLRRISRQ